MAEHEAHKDIASAVEREGDERLILRVCKACGNEQLGPDRHRYCGRCGAYLLGVVS